MASLKKPAICGTCSETSLTRFFDPERWVCDGCGTTVAQRAQRISGICRGCGKTESVETPFKKGKNRCLKCENEYMVEWRKKNPDWNKGEAFKKRRFEVVRACRQRSPESFIKALYNNLTRPIRKKGLRNNANIAPKRLAILNDVTVTREDLVEMYHNQGGLCALSKLKMEHKFGDLCSISIDRKDSGRGYHKDNIHLVCKWINNGKGSHTITEFITMWNKLNFQH